MNKGYSKDYNGIISSKKNRRLRPFLFPHSLKNTFNQYMYHY